MAQAWTRRGRSAGMADKVTRTVPRRPGVPGRRDQPALLLPGLVPTIARLRRTRHHGRTKADVTTVAMEALVGTEQEATMLRRQGHQVAALRRGNRIAVEVARRRGRWVVSRTWAAGMEVVRRGSNSISRSTMSRLRRRRATFHLRLRQAIFRRLRRRSERLWTRKIEGRTR